MARSLRRDDIIYTVGGKLTDSGREEVRRLANSGMTTEEIKEIVPATVPIRSIIAHVAVSHRKT